MGRTKRDSRIENRSGRHKLDAQREPYWTTLEPRRALGYRRGVKGAGTWIARLYCPEAAPKQRQKALGVADDLSDADGVEILSFAQAQAVARKWFEAELQSVALEVRGERVRSGPYSLAEAIQDYLEDAGHRGMKALYPTTKSAGAHILPDLGELQIEQLTRKRIQAWHLKLADSPRRSGRKKAKDTAEPSEDQKRARKGTANRVLTILKAALNFACREGRYSGPAHWRDVSPFKEVSVCRTRFLTREEQRRLVAACPEDFRILVMAALYTGCRYSELCRLRVEDFDPIRRTLFIEKSKSGKPRSVSLKKEAAAWFVRLAEGQEHGTPLIRRSEAKRSTREGQVAPMAWAPHDQKKLMYRACAAAGIEPLCFHELRHTYASTLVIARMPLLYVAKQLGHSDTRMVERYYGKLAPSAVGQAIDELVPDLDLLGRVKVEALRLAVGG